MGYDTSFRGTFSLSRPLTIAEKRKIDALNEGDQKVGPGGHCDWEINEDGTELRHNGSENSYDYVQWIRYIADTHLAPIGVKLNGMVEWDGAEQGDAGLIIAKDNVVTTKRAKISYE